MYISNRLLNLVRNKIINCGQMVTLAFIIEKGEISVSDIMKEFNLTRTGVLEQLEHLLDMAKSLVYIPFLQY